MQQIWDLNDLVFEFSVLHCCCYICMQIEKVTAHNPTSKEISREKKDDKKSEAEMRENVAKRINTKLKQKRPSKLATRVHAILLVVLISQVWVLVKLKILLKLAALVDITCDHLKRSRESERMDR